MRTVNEIIIHCTATKEGRVVSVTEVDKWHKDRGLKGIGYHYLIGLGGEIWIGRPVSEIGAHCSGHNLDTIGVCYVGGLDLDGKPKDTRTVKQKEAIKALICQLMKKFSIKKISGHNQYANKACPSFSVLQWEKEVGL